jgi:hypothetical protein
MQLPATVRDRSSAARKTLAIAASVLAFLLALAALAAAGMMGFAAFQEMSGSQMVAAGGSSLLAAMLVMVGIHLFRA